MKKEKGLREEALDEEMDLLEFNPDDISLEDLDEGNQEGISDDDIIELLDLVKEEGQTEEVTDDVMDLLEGDTLKEEIGRMDMVEEDLPDMDKMLKEEEPELKGLETDVAELPLESEFPDEEALTVDESFDEIEEGDLEKMFESEPSGEFELAPELSLASEDLKKEMEDEFVLKEAVMESEAGAFQDEPVPVASLEQEPQKEVPMAVEPEGAALAGLSEEKIEAIVTRVVQGTVERVAREAFSGVAEKVIGEAIEALKQSLKPASD